MTLKYIRELFKRIITPKNRDPISSEENTRFKHFSVFLLLGIPIMIFYGLYNIVFEDNLILVVLILLSAVGLAVGWFFLWYFRKGRIVYRINALLFSSLILYMLLIGGEGGSKILWMYTFPLISFFLLGKNEGLFWCVTVFLFAMALFGNPFNVSIVYDYPNEFITRFIMTYATVSIVAYWYEYFHFHNLNEIELKNQILQQEIRERKQVEEKLLKSEQKFQSLSENSQDNIMRFDSECCHLYLNSAALKSYGRANEEIIGKTHRELGYDEKLCALWEKNITRVFKTGKSNQEIFDWEGVNSTIILDWRLYPEFDKNKIVNSVLGISRDITKIKENEELLHQSQKMEALGNLTGGIAHDFNNILGGITGNLFLLKKMNINSKMLQKIENVEHLSFRAAEMINQLLAFSRKSRVELIPLAITSFTKEIFEFLKTSVPENIEMQHDICTEKLIINGDPTQLHQVLMNLVNNARDSIDGVKEPYIIIQLDVFQPDDAFVKEHPYFTLGKFAHLSVKDNGCGIPENLIEHLFEPFFTTKAVGKGTGLGLAMVFGAVKTHQGYIEVESSDDSGSTFHIFIPLIEQEEIALTSPLADDSVDGQGELILLVDDEPLIREIMAESLVSMDYKVLEAADGLEAFEVFKEHKDQINLVISDVVMPKCGGAEFAERVREVSPNMPFLFVTGYDKEDELSNYKHIKNSEILSKPVKYDGLRLIIYDLLHMTQ